jgi:maltose/maltodextrin transport system substrate-binding protein/arabinogalactan oligomer/maltooligosaccharide transport system substrate-binding protein
MLLAACGGAEPAATPVTTPPETPAAEAPTEAPAAEEPAVNPTEVPPTVEPAAEVEFETVVLPGSFQAQLGCDGDWQADCDKTALTWDGMAKLWRGTFDIEQGDYEYKVAINNGWDINFGKDGKAGGDNLKLSLTKDAPVSFAFDPATKLVEVMSEGISTTPPAASVKGGLVIWADRNRVPALEELAAKFKAENGIDVVVEQLGFGDVRDVFTVAGPAGEGPDIIVGAHDWLGELAASGLLAPIDLGDKAKDFAPASLDAFTYSGELYGMPNAIENVGLLRNKDLVPDAPTTWAEVAEISRDLTANNKDGADANVYGFVREEGGPYSFFPIQTAFGGYIFGKNADGSWNPQDVGMDEAGSIAAAKWYEKMIADGFQPKAMAGDTLLDWFEQGKVGMIIAGPWDLPRLRTSNINYEFSTIPSETQDGTPFLGAQGFMVSAFSSEPLLAQVFLNEYVATEEAMKMFYDADPRPPAYLPFAKTLTDPDIVALGEAGTNAVPMPTIPQMGAVWSAWSNALTLIAQGSDTPENAFKNAAQQIRDAIAED